MYCDGCCPDKQTFLRGVRYKCSTCPDYDLCSSCMDIHDKGGDAALPTEQGRYLFAAPAASRRHPRDHLFLRVPRNLGRAPPPALANRSSWVHPRVACAECRVTPIVGYRYFCTVCATSFCEQCEQQGLPGARALGCHSDDHNLLKMVPPRPAAAPLTHQQQPQQPIPQPVNPFTAPATTLVPAALAGRSSSNN